MKYIFAMAGLAEAATAQALQIIAVALFFAAVLSVIAWWRRSWIIGLMACFICLAIGTFFEPWMAFTPPTLSGDPDEIYWLLRCRIAAVFWILCCLLCGACLCLVLRHKKVQLNTPPTSSTPPSASP